LRCVECIAGVLFLDECPVEGFIPIYLIVFGAFSACVSVTSMIVSIYKRHNPFCELTNSKLSKFYTFVNAVFSCFLLAWFIAGQ